MSAFSDGNHELVKRTLWVNHDGYDDVLCVRVSQNYLESNGIPGISAILRATGYFRHLKKCNPAAQNARSKFP